VFGTSRMPRLDTRRSPHRCIAKDRKSLSTVRSFVMLPRRGPCAEVIAASLSERGASVEIRPAGTLRGSIGDADPFFVEEGDRDAAREVVASTGDAEPFLYHGSEHYFADSSLPSTTPRRRRC
jgi:hypothetical protein